jgi:hypothetical protein
MESELLKLLSHLPSPVAAIAVAFVCLMLGIRLLDDLRHRRPLENAKIEREIWALELANAKASLELRHQYPEPDADGAVVAELLARGQFYTLMSRKVQTEDPPEPRFWSTESHNTWLPLRVLEVARRFSFGSWLWTMAAAIIGAIGADALSFKYPPFVGIATEAILQAQLVLIGLLMAASVIASIVRWVSGKEYGSEMFEPPAGDHR